MKTEAKEIHQSDRKLHKIKESKRDGLGNEERSEWQNAIHAEYSTERGGHICSGTSSTLSHQFLTFSSN